MTDGTKSHYEVVVVGAGVSGIYQIQRVADLGVDAAQNVYVTGLFDGNVDFDTSATTTWTSTDPSDGWMIPASTWSSVLLPAPFGPMTPRDSPRSRLNDTLRSAQNGSSGSRENICMND